ncbi:MAG TPA: PEP-CTERM sorting domain-containing protein [Tepidisphaeraceae bacterium]|nr:PEP-CTERM sorting domain-containing protein [Tepidisphaeraceae bacterium]
MRDQTQLPQGTQSSLLHALDRHFMACAAVAAIATVAGQTEQADANIVYSGIQNVPLTNGSPGIYINLVTDLSTATPGANPGWDINPYVNGGSSQNFFGMYLPLSLSTFLVKSSSPTAGGADVAKLPFGTIISSASTLIGEPAQFGFMNNPTAGDWLAAGTGYMGIEFTEASVNGGAPVFGWVQIAKTVDGEPARGGSTGITFVDWAYDDSGASIIAGATSLPEPSSLALLATGAIGLFARRGQVKLRRSNA